MKKVFAIILAGALLLGLAGCQNSVPKLNDPSFAPLAMTPGETYTSYEGIEIQVDSLNWHEGNQKSSLVVAWNNQTKYEVTYGASFAIERLEGEEWVSCAIRDDLVFIAIAYLLPAGQTTKKTYTLTDMFDVTSPGTYRFITDCYVACSDKHIKCQLTAEFTVGDVKCASDSKETGTDVQWAAQYIRTDGYSEGVLYPSVRVVDSLEELKDNLIHHLVPGFDEAWEKVTGGAPLDNALVHEIFEIVLICSQDQEFKTDEKLTVSFTVEGIGPDDAFVIVHKPTGSDEWIVEEHEIDENGVITIHPDKLSPFAIIKDSGAAPVIDPDAPDSPQTGVEEGADRLAAALIGGTVLAFCGILAARSRSKKAAR